MYYPKFNPASPAALSYLFSAVRNLTDPSNPLLGSNAAIVTTSNVLQDFYRSNPNVLSLSADDAKLLFGRYVLSYRRSILISSLSHLLPPSRPPLPLPLPSFLLFFMTLTANDVGVRVVDGEYQFLWLRLGFKINTTTSISSFEGIKVSKEQKRVAEGREGRGEARGEVVKIKRELKVIDFQHMGEGHGAAQPHCSGVCGACFPIL